MRLAPKWKQDFLLAGQSLIVSKAKFDLAGTFLQTFLRGCWQSLQQLGKDMGSYDTPTGTCVQDGIRASFITCIAGISVIFSMLLFLCRGCLEKHEKVTLPALVF